MFEGLQSRTMGPALEPLERRRLLTVNAVAEGAAVDDQPPTVEMNIPVLRESVPSFLIDVTYSDPSGVEIAPVDHDLTLWGENGDTHALPVEVSRAADGKSVTVRYEAKHFGGPWGSYDNGKWEIRISPGDVRDSVGNRIPWAPIGTFKVAIPVRGTITGKAILDPRERAADAKPEGVAGVRVFADLDGDGRFDAGDEPSGTTEADGTYSIDGLKRGAFRVTVEPPPGYVHTTDDEGYDVRVSAMWPSQALRPFRLATQLPGLHVSAGTAGNDVIEVFRKGGRFRVRVNGMPAEQVADDVIDIRVYGRGGNDRIVLGDGTGAARSVFGGEGNDTLLGSSGPDMLDGEGGADLIDGRDGDDWLVGGSQNDSIFARAGDDIIHGGRGRDVLRGEAGDDTLVDENGDKDTFSGGAGRDEAFADLLRGGCDGWLNLTCWDGWRDDLAEVEKVRWRRD